MAYQMKSSPAKLGAALRAGRYLVKYGKKIFTKSPKKTIKSTDDIETEKINKLYEKFKKNIRKEGTKKSPTPLSTKKSNIGFSVNAPIYDSQGRCFGRCSQRYYDPKHNFSIGTKLDIKRKDSKWGAEFGGYGGYTFNPKGGTGGFKGYIGANIGGKVKEMNKTGVDSDIQTFAQGVLSGGYEGEIGKAHSYKNYKRGRRGNPKKWGVGAYVKKDLIGDKKYDFGGYAKYGNLNITGGTGGFTIGFGKTIR